MNEVAEQTSGLKDGNKEFEENIELPCAAPPPIEQYVVDAREVFSFCGGQKSVNAEELDEKSINGKIPDLANA